MSQQEPTPDKLPAASDPSGAHEERTSSASREPSHRPSRSRSKKAKGPVQRKGARIDRGAPRHQARILAMQALFEHDMTAHDLEDVLARLSDEEGEDVPPPVRDHTFRLARGVDSRCAEIDPYIAEAAPAFPIPQLAAIDRSVLRLAVYELLFERDVPFRVVINEAVEIAKRFGGPSSGRFVNGVLGTIVDRIPPADTASDRDSASPPRGTEPRP